MAQTKFLLRSSAFFASIRYFYNDMVVGEIILMSTVFLQGLVTVRVSSECLKQAWANKNGFNKNTNIAHDMWTTIWYYNNFIVNFEETSTVFQMNLLLLLTEWIDNSSYYMLISIF